MNRLPARAVKALFLVLTALLLTLACATAEASYYNHYSWDGKKLCTHISSASSFKLLYLSSQEASLAGGLYTPDISGSFVIQKIHVTKDSSLLFQRDIELPNDCLIALASNVTLNIYSNNVGTFNLKNVHFILESGSQLNFHDCSVDSSSIVSNGGTVNVYHGDIRNSNSLSLNNSAVNIYGGGLSAKGICLDKSTISIFGGSLAVTPDSDSAISLTDSAIGIHGGTVALTSENVPLFNADHSSSLNFNPIGDNTHIRVFNGIDASSRQIIGAYNQSNSGGALEKLRNYTALLMDKAVMITIGIDPTPQSCYVDKSPCFEVKALTEGESPSGFTVEYKQNGTYSTNPPTQPGTFDVRITRALDDTYLPFEQVIAGALVITKHSQTAPTGVTAVAETLPGSNDGRLVGITADMEYRSEAASGYTAVTGTEVTNLAPGTYFVRYRETATHFASADVKIEVADCAAYRITRGDGTKFIVGQNTALSFTANGPLAKLAAVLVDGKTLDAKHYTTESGSTIILLAADYVKTLAVGEHTLTVRYTDGETSARFTVMSMPQTLPQTGDSSSLLRWAALLGACCAGLCCLNRRRG